jgi:hypothetical protein
MFDNLKLYLEVLSLFLVCSLGAYKQKGFDGMGFRVFVPLHKMMN